MNNDSLVDFSIAKLLRDRLLADGSLHLDSEKASGLLRWLERSEYTHKEKDKIILELISELKKIMGDKNENIIIPKLDF